MRKMSEGGRLSMVFRCVYRHISHLYVCVLRVLWTEREEGDVDQCLSSDAMR